MKFFEVLIFVLTETANVGYSSSFHSSANESNHNKQQLHQPGNNGTCLITVSNNLQFQSSRVEGIFSQATDFCKKASEFFSEPGYDFECVKTAANGYVHMVTSCPLEWKEPGLIRKSCEYTQPLKSNLWLNVPITKNGTTFKNIFCLFCHNESLPNWNLWELGFSCINQTTRQLVELPEQKLNESTGLQPYEEGFWTYTSAGNVSICFLHPKVPEKVVYSKCCRNQSEHQQDTCFTNSSNSLYSTNCVIRPSNNITPKQSCYPEPNNVNFTVHVELKTEMMPQFSDCDKIKNNHTLKPLYNIICMEAKNQHWTTNQCSDNRYLNITNNSDISFEDGNQTLVVISLKKKFLKNKWFYLNQTAIFLCSEYETGFEGNLLASQEISNNGTCLITVSNNLQFQSSRVEGIFSQATDFCKKASEFFSEPGYDFECVKTAANGYVHMVTSCPLEWKEPGLIRKSCEYTQPLKSNLWLNVPVTKNGTTFKNIFCLFCHNESLPDWNLWELGFSCINQTTRQLVELPEQKLNESTGLQPYEEGFWTYTSAGNVSICFLHPKVPEKVVYSKCCRNQSEHQQNTCFTNSNNSLYSTNCVIRPSNNITPKQSCYPEPNNVNFTVHVELKTEMMPQFSDCDKIKNNHTLKPLYNIICMEAKNQHWTTNECSDNRYLNITNNSDISFEDGNQTLVVISLKKKFLKNKWFYLNQTAIFLCSGYEKDGSKTKICSPSSGNWFTKLILFILKLTSVGIFFYFVAFYWLSEKSLWDRILVAFGAMLLVQLLCVTFHPHILNNTVATIMWHYSLLCCSTWILILSYDYRVNLYKTNRIYVGPDNSANKKFIKYCIFNCVFPLIASILAVSFGSTLKIEGCNQHESLLTETPVTAFWVIAFLLFLFSSYFLTQTVVMLYLDRHLYYSRPSSIVPGTATLTMVGIWMLGSLWMLAYFEMADWVFYSLHLLQAVFFLVFAFNKPENRFKRRFNRSSEESQYQQLENREMISAPLMRNQVQQTENSTFYS